MNRSYRRPIRAEKLIDASMRKVKVSAMLDALRKLAGLVPTPGVPTAKPPVAIAPTSSPISPTPSPTTRIPKFPGQDPTMKLGSEIPEKGPSLLGSFFRPPAHPLMGEDPTSKNVSTPADQEYMTAVIKDPKKLQEFMGPTTPLKDLMLGRRMPQ